MSSALMEARASISGKLTHFEQRARSSMDRRKKAGVDIGGAISGSKQAQMMSGAGRDQQRMADAYRSFKQWVYSSTHWVARRVGGQPWFAGEMEKSPENPERGHTGPGIKLLQPWLAERTPRFLRKSVSDEQLNVLPSHPVLDVLDHPNPLQRRFEFLYMSAISMQITGVCYWVGGMVKDKEAEGGERLEIWALPSNYITPTHKDGLFSGYKLKLPGEQGEGTDLDPANVARTYFPDPTDLTAVYPPIAACWGAIKTDEYIQRNQEQSFERANTPRIGLVIGKDEATGRRPTLQGHQRRAVVRAIREIWDQTTRYGDPAILDGLIEQVIQLDRANKEMDWINSGRVTKDRVFQTFSVHPFVCGDPQNVTKAQAIVAEEVTCNNAVNPLMDSFSETATTWLGPMYERPERLVVWLDPAKPADEDAKVAKWNQALGQKAVGIDEYRQEVLGLPPVEPEEPEPVMRTNLGAVTATIQLLTAVGGGQVQRESAIELLKEMGVEEERAEAIVGEEPPEPEQPAAGAVPPGAPGAPAAPGAPPAEPENPYAPVDGMEWWERPKKHLEGQHDQSSHGRGGDKPLSPGVHGKIEVLDRRVKTSKVEFVKRAAEVKEAIDAAESANTDREYDRMFAAWRQRDEQYEKAFVKAETRWQKAKSVLGGLVDFMLAKGEDDRLQAAIAEAEAAAKEMQDAVDGMAELLAEIKRGPKAQKHLEGQHDQSSHGRDAAGNIEPTKREAVKVGESVAARREGKGKDAKIVLENGEPAPSHIQAAMIPPAWENVRVYTNRDSEVWVEATQTTARGVEGTKKVYNPTYEAEQQMAKHVRVEKMMEEDTKIKAQIKAGLKDEKTKEEAAVAMLIDKQATRPGSESDTKGLAKHYGVEMKPENVIVTPPAKGKGPPKVEIEVNGEKIHIRDRGAADELMRRKESGQGLEDSTYWLKSHGATTLEGRHVVEAEDGVRLQFVGKEGVWHDHLVQDKQLAAMLVERAKTAGERGGKLFDTNAAKLAAYVKTLDTGRFSPKDFRTKRANEIAAAELKPYIGKTPKDAKEREGWIKEVATKVSHVLGNKPAQCVESYINPHIWDALRTAA